MENYWFNPGNLSFYPESVYGVKTKQIPDPDFEWPMVTVPDPEFQYDPDDGTRLEPDYIEIPDPDAQPPLVDVPNPDCNIPVDAVPVTNNVYEAVLVARSNGKVISADDDGQPVISEPKPPSLNELAKQKRREIDAAAKAAIAVLRDSYPDYEQLSWDRQEREARAGEGLLIESIALARELSLDELIPRILAKVEEYEVLAGQIIGTRQGLFDQIDDALNAGDRDTLENITWPNE